LILFDARAACRNATISPAKHLSDIALDPSGSLVVSDLTYQGFIILAPDGSLVKTGERIFTAAAPGLWHSIPAADSLPDRSGEQEARNPGVPQPDSQPPAPTAPGSGDLSSLAVSPTGSLFTTSFNQPAFSK